MSNVHTMDRRNFLKAVATGTGVVALSGCSQIGLFNGDSRPFSVIMLPDTQQYADIRTKKKGGADWRDRFFSQTRWIREAKNEYNIRMVSHVGDIVQTDYPAEWVIADQAFRTLDGKVPYSLAPGNHDMGYIDGRGTANSRDTHMNDYFPPARFEKCDWYGGHYGSGNENSYAFFEAGNLKFMLMSLEFTPRDEVLAWADKVVAAHPDRRVIVSTHWHLNAKGERFAKSNYRVGGNTAVGLWDKLLSRHPNIFLVLSGHVIGESRLTSERKNLNPVHQVMADYQGEVNGGEGYLRILTFYPKENKIHVQTYSPFLDKFRREDSNEFTLSYAMCGE